MPNWPTERPDPVAEPLAGSRIASASLPGKRDLSDWVELTEAVEPLCPVWPEWHVAWSATKCLLRPLLPQHALPRRLRVEGERINLTFRRIEAGQASPADSARRARRD